MRLTIQITTADPFTTTRRLENLLANCTNEIHDFILNGTTESLSASPRMGKEEYNLEVRIEPSEDEINIDRL